MNSQTSQASNRPEFVQRIRDRQVTKAQRTPTASQFKEKIGGIAKVMGLVIASVWTLYLYLDGRQDKRIEAALKYVERFNSETMMTSRDATEKFWITRDGVDVLFNGRDIDVQQHALMRITMGDQEGTVKRLLDFYSEVALCSEKRICDSATVCIYFADPARNFVNLYAPLIDIWGFANRSKLRDPVDEFVHGCSQNTSQLQKLGRFLLL